MRRDHAAFEARRAVILVLCPESAAAFRRYWETENLPFIGLPDPTHSVLKLYGQEVNLFKLGRQPAQVIVDIEGIARFAHYGHTPADIPANEELLGILDELNAERQTPSPMEVIPPDRPPG